MSDEIKKELEFRDPKTKEKFKTTAYTEEERNGKMMAVADTPSGSKAYQFIRDDNKSKNEDTMNILNWIQIILPSLTGVAVLLTNNLLWLWLALPIVFIVTELFYYNRILKLKYTREVFNWKLEKFKGFSVAMSLIAGYVGLSFVAKKVLGMIGWDNASNWLKQYGMYTGVGIVFIMAVVGWWIMNYNLAINKLGKDRVR